MADVCKAVFRRPWLVLLVLALVAMMAMGLAGCGDEEEQLDEALEELDQAIDEAIDEASAHTVEVTGFTCPVPPDADTGDPAAENVFASVNVTVKNDSDVEQVTGPANFTLEDEDGTMYDADILYEGPGAMETIATIAPGEEISGVIIFEVPATAKPKYLVEDLLVGDPIRVELPEAG